MLRSSLGVCLCLLLSVSAFAALQPFQQNALDKMLATMDPQKAALAKPQLEQMLSTMNEAQVQQVLAAMSTRQTAPASAAPPPPTPVPVTSADLAFNKAQWEPAIRKAWDGEHAYDEYVRARLASACPPIGTYAVFGSGWRYEIGPPSPSWPTASNSADLDVQIIGPSYAPQDGRYRFDFSKVRTTFDKTAVDSAIDHARAEYVEIGRAFTADAKAHRVGDTLPTGQQIQN